MYTKVKNNKLKTHLILPLMALSLSACAPYYHQPQPAPVASDVTFRVGGSAPMPIVPQQVVSNNLDHIPFAEVVETVPVPNVNRNMNVNQRPTFLDQTGRPYQEYNDRTVQMQNRSTFQNTPTPTYNVRKPTAPWDIIYESGDVSPALNRDRIQAVYPRNPSNNVSYPDISPVGGESYKVQQGDTVFQVMRNTGIHWNDIIRLNNLPHPYTIYTGQSLRLR